MKASLSSVETYVVSTYTSTLNRNLKEKDTQLPLILNNLRIIILFECLWNLGIRRFERDNKIEKLYFLK